MCNLCNVFLGVFFALFALPVIHAQAEDSYDVVLLAKGDSIIMTIKVCRESNPGLGLADAKKMAESAPVTVKKGVSKEEGEKIVKAFDGYHAKAELRDAKGIAVAATTPVASVEGKFDLVLETFSSKILTIVVVRELTGLGLADAKKLVESAPVSLKAGMHREEAEKFTLKLEAVGATAELKASAK